MFSNSDFSFSLKVCCLFGLLYLGYGQHKNQFADTIEPDTTVVVNQPVFQKAMNTPDNQSKMIVLSGYKNHPIKNQ